LKPRFEVSTEGMAELQSGREPWQLAKELVANAFDESISICNVNVAYAKGVTTLVVYDDGKGFQNIPDAWTLMGHTNKRSNPESRGRFNIGEKEILSIAIDAEIVTSGVVIIFPEEGGRKVKSDLQRVKGTRITCRLPWTRSQADELDVNLTRLIPPGGVEYYVNGSRVRNRKPIRDLVVTLDTVLAGEGIGAPLRATRRKTRIELYDDTDHWLYEMGIPVQPIPCGYSVNVGQKVPLPPNRDVVKDSYLRDIYVAIVNAMANDITDPAAAWVSSALEDKDIDTEATKTIIKRRYGDKVVLWSSNQVSNERALEAGYEVVHARSLGAGVKDAMVAAGLQQASVVFKAPGLETGGKNDENTTIPREKWTDDMEAMEVFARRLCKALLNFECGVGFYSDITSPFAALWFPALQSIKYNVGRLGHAWFARTGLYYGDDQIGLALHEFAHTEGEGHMFGYQDQLKRLAGKSTVLALTNPEIFLTDMGGKK
jgi:hypothetical protein